MTIDLPFFLNVTGNAVLVLPISSANMQRPSSGHGQEQAFKENYMCTLAARLVAWKAEKKLCVREVND